jgi:hypothetical protein
LRNSTARAGAARQVHSRAGAAAIQIPIIDRLDQVGVVKILGGLVLFLFVLNLGRGVAPLATDRARDLLSRFTSQTGERRHARDGAGSGFGPSTAFQADRD